MPKRSDIHSILIIGSGPIVIGQGCEFDYSGTQACKALREEGYRVVLINSNPATIMTDPDMADRTYIEPITPDFIDKVLQRERDDGAPVDALLPTLGGQTGLNCAIEVAERGILERHGVEMIGAAADAIRRAENRTDFKATMERIGLDVPRSGVAHSWPEARRVIERVHLPCCIRPAYTLGGAGGGFCRTRDEFETIARRGLAYSRIGEVLIEEDLYGWKEFELEVMRDRADNVVIICSIENIDPMGVHTGDSITVAPAQTLSNAAYQRMRDAAIAIIRAIGVDTGGCNIQFAVDPKTGRQVVIEMNPRVSRSSALASKATGYPIARIAAKLAVGYTLDELPNDITKTTPASFEPAIDYVVVKMPRWTFEKFPDADERLTTQMKSVGEAMAIGRTFKEALQKCIRSMEIKRFGFGLDDNDAWLDARRRRHESRTPDAGGGPPVIGGSTATEAPPDTEEQTARAWPIPRDALREKLLHPCQGRPYYIRYAFKAGWSVEQVHELTRIDPWFLAQMHELVAFEDERLLRHIAGPATRDASVDRCVPADDVRARSKQLGYSDVQCAHAAADAATHRASTAGVASAAEPRTVSGAVPGGDSRTASQATDSAPTAACATRGPRPVYKLVDTCAAEFDARTPYYYASHETPQVTVAPADGTVTPWTDDEIRVTERPKIVILGGGPNRIGQGIEFDYCCCHAAFAARDAGYESVMINSNPETVSTDFDTSDMLFFEPLTHEDVLNVIERLNGRPLTEPGGHVKGVIVQFGGQTPINLAEGLKDAGVPIIGTQPEAIHRAEDRDAFNRVLRELSLLQPKSGIAKSRGDATGIARRIGYPVLVRPSYVLGGRGMKVCNNDTDLDAFFAEAFGATDRAASFTDNPILIDKFLSDAIEVDVDAVADFRESAEPLGFAGAPRPDAGMCARARADARADGASDKLAACDAGAARRGDTASHTCMVAGIMEHIEEAGIHSGDSTCVLPPFSLGPMVIEELYRSTRRLAERLNVCGAMNVQYAVLNRTIYVLEVNPRASRTLPFVAKATGVPWARIATRVMLGEPLVDVLAAYGVDRTPRPTHTAIKAPVFPFEKFAGVDVILGPEMHSTGEVMAIAGSFGRAFAKAQIACGLSLPTAGNALVSVHDADKPRIVSIARDLYDMGFTIYSTTGTRGVLHDAGIPAHIVYKSKEKDTPYLADLIADGTLHLLINTPIHTGPASDEGRWRAAATAHRIPLITTLAGARAAVEGIRALRRGDDGRDAVPLEVRPLQRYFEPRPHVV
ncbi:MAG: carbamoyl-phosphate synthase large subunit [Phycisphaerae bacterium]